MPTYTTQEAARKLGITDSRVRQLILRGQMRARYATLGRVRVHIITENELLRHDALMKARRQRLSEKTSSAA